VSEWNNKRLIEKLGIWRTKDGLMEKLQLIGYIPNIEDKDPFAKRTLSLSKHGE